MEKQKNNHQSNSQQDANNLYNPSDTILDKIAISAINTGVGIIPVKSNKSPVINGWTSTTNWSCEPKKLSDWLEGFRNPYWGLPCGPVNGAFVVDVDLKKDEKTGKPCGPPILGSLTIELLKKASFMQYTKSSYNDYQGQHFFFKFEERLSLFKNIRLQNTTIDLKTGGGQVVMYIEFPGKKQWQNLKPMPDEVFYRLVEMFGVPSNQVQKKKHRVYGPGKNNSANAQRATKAGYNQNTIQAAKDLKELLTNNANRPDFDWLAHTTDYLKMYEKNFFKESNGLLTPSKIKDIELEEANQAKKIAYIPSIDIETDIKNRLDALNIKVRFNIRDRVEELKTGDKNWEIFDDGIEAKLYSDCHKKIKPNLEGKIKKISQADWKTHTKALVHREEVDPFKVWLENLPKWDKEPRLEKVLSLLFTITGEARLAKWAFKAVLLSAITRTFRPGYKFDTMIVLQGPQGIGKSSLWSCLFEKESWFSDNIHFSGNDKEIIETTCGTVLVENAELAGARKAELEKIKALITRQTDKVRFAYARKISVLPRMFVIVGTTNEPCSLPNDQTGNRRFIPISLDKKEDTAWNNGKKVRDYIKENRKQLWAEALQRFKNKENPFLPTDLQAIAKKEAEKHRSKNELLESAILEKVNEIPDIMPIKMKQIVDHLMDQKIIPSGGAHSGLQREIAGILRKEGWSLKIKRIGKNPTIRIWERVKKS